MFTLEDQDLQGDLDALREAHPDMTPDGSTAPEADALEHPDDYFITGW